MKNTKIKTLLTIGISGLLLTSLFPVAHAVEMTPNPTRAAMRQERQTTKITLNKTNADKEIERRITVLNILLANITNMKRVTSDEKSSLTSKVQNEITTLNTLKTKIDGDTDLATLKTDKQSIVTSYRVFLVFIPQIRITAMADKILELAALLQTKNPSTDSSAKITDAITQANAAITGVATLNPADWPNNKSTIESARTNVRTAYADLKSAWAAMKK